MDQKLIIEMVCKIIGGLGIFLLGMKYMSEGLQTIAGPTLRKIISSVTNNRFMAVIAGIFVTCLVQSSSVSTVMAIGFVNSGIMALNQAIGVILGANIGTTITGWILVLKIGKWGLPMIGIASFFYLFSKKERVKYIAFAIIGMGMIFFGLELMKSGFKPMRSQEEFVNWFNVFNAGSYAGILKCVAVGCILTFIVQSSSATLGITIGLASQGLLDFESAAALVLGENIGTTITAMLASIGSSANAKRAAYFHVLFNLAGVLWITFIFKALYLPFIYYFMEHYSGIPDVMAPLVVDGKESFPHTTTGIALVHSIFNITNVLLFLPFTGFFANFLNKAIADSRGKEKLYLTHLDFSKYDTGFAAIEQSKFEVERMASHTIEMFSNLKIALTRDERSEEVTKLIFERENILDTVQKEITGFLTDVRTEVLSHDLVEESNSHLHLADEYESVSDYITQVLKLDIRLKESDLTLSKEQIDEINGLHDTLAVILSRIINLEKREKQNAIHQSVTAESATIKEVIRRHRTNHWARIANVEMNPLLMTTYTDMLVSYRKILDHLINISEAKLPSEVNS